MEDKKIKIFILKNENISLTRKMLKLELEINYLEEQILKNEEEIERISYEGLKK